MSDEPSMSDLIRATREGTRERQFSRFFGTSLPDHQDPVEPLRMPDLGADDKRPPDTTKETPE